jgi:hypothetical protein
MQGFTATSDGDHRELTAGTGADIEPLDFDRDPSTIRLVPRSFHHLVSAPNRTVVSLSDKKTGDPADADPDVPVRNAGDDGADGRSLVATSSRILAVELTRVGRRIPTIVPSAVRLP